MDKKIKIKKIITFEDYSLTTFNNDIQIVGLGKKEVQDNGLVSSRELIKATFRLGENLNESIFKYMNEKRKILKYNYFHDNLEAQKRINSKIISLVDDFLRITNKNASHYHSMFDLYKNAFKLFKNNNIDVSDLISPSFLRENIYSFDRYSLGIFESNEHSKFKAGPIIIELSFKKTFDLLKKYEEDLDYKPLAKSVNYIPISIKDLFKEIIVKGSNRDTYSFEYKTSKEITTFIRDYCKIYGMPFWTDRIDIGEIIINKQFYYSENEISSDSNSHFKEKSSYEIAQNTIPIHNLLFISLTIFLYFKSIKELTQGGKNAFEDLKKYEDLFHLFGLNFSLNANSNKKTFNLLIKNSEFIDDYILSNCNSIYDFPLKTFRKKVLYVNNGKSIFLNETIYESLIIAAWEIFYLDYIGNYDIGKPLLCCSNCKKEIEQKKHTLKNKNIFCHECYIEHKNNLNRERVRKFRELKN